MGQSWDELERAALELLRNQFAGIEEWSPEQLQYMIAMAKAALKARKNGGQGIT